MLVMDKSNFSVFLGTLVHVRGGLEPAEDFAWKSSLPLAWYASHVYSVGKGPMLLIVADDNVNDPSSEFDLVIVLLLLLLLLLLLAAVLVVLVVVVLLLLLPLLL